MSGGWRDGIAVIALAVTAVVAGAVKAVDSAGGRNLNLARRSLPASGAHTALRSAGGAVEAHHAIRTELTLTVSAVEAVITDALVRAEASAGGVERLAARAMTVTVVLVAVVDDLAGRATVSARAAAR